MPFPTERRKIVIEQEAARRRFLTLCERSFPEWTKRLSAARLIELTDYFLDEIPIQFLWLERTDGLKMGGGYPASAFKSEPITELTRATKAP